MTQKPFPSYEEFWRRRVRMPPKDLANKYVGLFFAIPFLVIVAVLVIWFGANLLASGAEISGAEGGSLNDDTILWWRSFAIWAVVIIGLVTIVANAKDPGTGPITRLGHVMMPLANALYVGRWLSGIVDKSAALSNEEIYERHRASAEKRQAR